MISHWDRPGWTADTRRLHWMLTFGGGESDLLIRTEECQAALAGLGLDLVPPDGLHVTMVRVGDTDAVTPETVEALADHVQQLALPRLSLTAHPLAGSRGAIRYSLTPWTGLVHLHAALTTAGQELGVPGGAATAEFRPHCGVAYSPAPGDARPVREAVTRLRALAPVALTVDAVDLVELRRRGRTYRWRVLRRVPLTGSPTAQG
nr:hypothetical protein KPHV_86040 [Kitasatospora purpeofusca]